MKKTKILTMCLSALFICTGMFISCQKEQLPAKEEINNQSNDAIKQEKASNIVAYVYTNVPAGLPRHGTITVTWSNDNNVTTCSRTVTFNLATNDYYGNGRVDIQGCNISWTNATHTKVDVVLGLPSLNPNSIPLYIYKASYSDLSSVGNHIQMGPYTKHDYFGSIAKPNPNIPIEKN